MCSKVMLQGCLWQCDFPIKVPHSVRNSMRTASATSMSAGSTRNEWWYPTTLRLPSPGRLHTRWSMLASTALSSILPNTLAKGSPLAKSSCQRMPPYRTDAWAHGGCSWICGDAHGLHLSQMTRQVIFLHTELTPPSAHAETQIRPLCSLGRVLHA